MFKRLKQLFGKREEWKIPPEDIKNLLLVFNDQELVKAMEFGESPEDLSTLLSLLSRFIEDGNRYELYRGYPAYISNGKVVTDAVRVKKGQ